MDRDGIAAPPPLIEAAALDDVPDLARLRWDLYAEEEGSREAPETYQDRFVAFALKALATERWNAWIARDRAGPVAARWLHAIERIPVPGKVAGPIGYLTSVYVAPRQRNTGLGSRMLGVVLAWARDEGYSCVITWPTPRSRPFYRRGGFDRLGEPFIVELVSDRPR